MARDDRVFSVLVACPSDVQEEAGLVRSAVEEVNLGMASLRAARLEVVDWQTHASPGIGSDPQDVINQQLPEDYDIFLGVMWARFGTATPRAGSGTEEEFERALTRHQANRSVRILFYFKQASLPPDAIDPAQLQKVQAFRERLKQEGVLYRDFEHGAEFERQLRQHLAQQLQALLVSSSHPDAKVDNDTPAGAQEEHAEEEGDGEELGFFPALEQLLTLTASGIGSVAGPMLARWRAQQLGKAKQIAAEADATVLCIQAEAQAKAREALVPSGVQAIGEVDIGTVIEQRVQFQEEKRQANIMSVVAKTAAQQEGREVEPSEPDHDWTARFFNAVQDVSSEEMQSLWARVLAGEVERRGSTSIRTLQVLKNLDQVTARLFRKLCSSCVYLPVRHGSAVDARVPSLGANAATNALQKYGFGFGQLNRLSEHGLIISDYNSWLDYTAVVKEGSGVAVPFQFQDAFWVLTQSDDRVANWDGKLWGVALSLSGRELAAVIDLEPAKEFAKALRAFLQQHGLSMTAPGPVRIA